jgi:hypothetical protein
MPLGEHGAAPAPDHVVHPIDRTSKEAGVLKRVGEELVKDATRHLESMGEFTRETMKPIAERAKDFALNLPEYWKSSLNSFTDRYTYESAGDRAQLAVWSAELGSLSAELEPELKKWEELTSPYSDRYDEGAIYTTAHQLLDSLRRASEKFQHPKENLQDPQWIAEAKLIDRVRSAVSGLSEQIGSRLLALADGIVVPPVTISAQTQEAMLRALQDPAGKRLADEAASAHQFREDFKTKFKEDGLLKMREDLIRINEQMVDEKLPKDAKAALEAAGKAIEESLKEFRKARLQGLEEARVPGRDAKFLALRNAEGDLISTTEKIRAKKMEPAERTATVADARAKAAALAVLEKPFLDPAAKIAAQAAQDSAERLSAYDQSLKEATSNIGKDLSGFWDSAKRDFLDTVESNSDDAQLKRTLDKAFDANFGKTLSTWRDLIGAGKEFAAIEKQASEILRTTDSYSTRAEGLVKAANADPTAMQPVLDRLNASLVAIREKVANQLKALLN